MAEGILGLGSGQAASLNQELIDKLKSAEEKARVAPIETSLEDLVLEREVFTNIGTKVSELLDAIKPFDLFVTGGSTAFDQKAATTSGDSVTFDAVDIAKLNNGVTTVNIDSLAQKDVYQTNAVNGVDKDALGDIGVLTIAVGAESFDFNTADYATYEELANAIDAKAGINASLDQVGTDSYRLVLKSENSGLDNKLTISGAASTALGLDLPANQLLTAQDMKAFVDGVEYNVSANELTVDGLKIAANKIGESTINVSDDKTQLETQMNTFITKFNEVVGLIEGETANAESPVQDRAALREIVSQIKNKLFGTYGENDDKSVFNYGLELDKNGFISLDSAKFTDAVQNDLDGLKDLLVGTAAKEGLGTQLKATLDELQFSGGVLSTYETSMNTREETLKADKEKAEEALTDKYKQLSIEFGAYGAIINQFEASFSGLKLMIQQSTAG